MPSLFAPSSVLPPDQTIRFLRMITSPKCRGEKRVPLSAIAAMCGVSRLALYRMLWTGRVSDDMAELLTPLEIRRQASLQAVGPRSRDPNQREIV